MIERHIPFTVDADNSEAFERFFADQYLPAAAKSPGYIRCELLRVAADPAGYEMTFRWQDADSAAGWRTSPVHEALQPELKALSSMGAIVVYEVIV